VGQSVRQREPSAPTVAESHADRVSVLVVGWAATPYVARGKGGRGAPNANVLPTNLILMKGIDVLGSPRTRSRRSRSPRSPNRTSANSGTG
jgi:hypothetical protein